MLPSCPGPAGPSMQCSNVTWPQSVAGWGVFFLGYPRQRRVAPEMGNTFFMPRTHYALLLLNERHTVRFLRQLKYICAYQTAAKSGVGNTTSFYKHKRV